VSGASVEINFKFLSSNPDICIFSFNDCVLFAELLIKCLHLYIIQLYASKVCIYK
jgi:hypothetical protein